MTIEVHFREEKIIKNHFIFRCLFPGEVSGGIRLVEKAEEWPRSTSSASSASIPSAKMVVRNTFLELEEDVNDKPPMRSKSQGDQVQCGYNEDVPGR